MGREVRMVPPDWEHPRDARGSYIPLFGRSYAQTAAEWDEGKRHWDAGQMQDYRNYPAVGWMTTRISG